MPTVAQPYPAPTKETNPTPTPPAPTQRAVVHDPRYAATLNARGLKFVSNPQKTGAAISVTAQEGRVLMAEKMGTTAATAPGAPGTPVASAPTSDGCLLTFTAASNGGDAITHYEAISTPDNIVTQAVGSVTTINVVGLAPDTPYAFRVRAVNSIGNGAYSALSNQITTLP